MKNIILLILFFSLTILLFPLENRAAEVLQILNSTQLQIGDQVNMLSQSWDGQRIYYTSSLLANWDKKEGEPGNLQYFKAYNWENSQLLEKFSIDFIEEKLGSPHQMRFGSHALYGQIPRIRQQSDVALR